MESQAHEEFADITSSRLETAARKVAGLHQEVSTHKGKPQLTQRLPLITSWLKEAHSSFAAHDVNGQLPSYAAEWMLDNFYIVEQALRQIAQDLPQGYYAQLPKLRNASAGDTMPMQGLPRIYALARAFLAHEEYSIEPARLQRYITAYQTVTSLDMGEVWALPIMLRLALLESLSYAAGILVHLFEKLPEFFTPIASRLDDEQVVAHVIPSLRVLDGQNWPEFFEAVSLVHQALSDEPGCTYAYMDFASRDLYRNEIEQLARHTKFDELAVTQQAVGLAQRACEQHGLTNGRTHETPPAIWNAIVPARHVGYYLVGAGRAELEARLGYRPRGAKALQRWLKGHPTAIYLGGAALFTLFLLAVAFAYTASQGAGPLMLGIVVLLSLIPTSTIALNMFNSLLTRLLEPSLLPKMDFSEGVPAHYRTMVVVPAMLSNAADIDGLCTQLEQHYLRNADGQLYTGAELDRPDNFLTFALLTDFSDAPQAEMPEDAALIAQASAAIAALNAKYPGRPFYLFHRRRLWNESEDVWMGWERKRGKLHEFNQLLRGDDATTYTTQVGHLAILPHVRFVITLDADTLLPRGEAQRLIGALAHPLNRAHFNSRGQVDAGYTILQPRTEIKPTSSTRSLFSSVFGGDAGFDLYTRAVSDIYQDLFGEGIFVGKGIYDVDAFERSLAGRVPENAILSHDLFEGIHGRAALVTDVVLYEDYPPHYLINVLRSHRWTRGDWQLLPWLFARVPYRDETDTWTKIPNELALIDRWKIFDNLRRSLLSPLLLLFFIAGWTFLPGAPWLWTLLAVLAPSTALLNGLLSALLGWAKGADPQAIGRDLVNHTIRWLLFIAFLPYESLLLLDAIATTLVRLFVRRRKLLQWVTAARTVRLFGDETTVGATLRIMLPSMLLVAALTFLILWVNPRALLAAAPFLAVWLLAWWIAHLISRPKQAAPTPLSAEQRQAMRVLARRTWLFYEHFVGPNDHWLPPDHFQEVPRGAVAHRTSPTNVGMYLLSALAAYDLGYIGAMNLVARLHSTFETMDRLDRYRGHFLNWIDTRSLEPLPPSYVSTVDSGNLAGALIALKQGSLQILQDPVWQWERWQGLLDLLPSLTEAFTQALGPQGSPLVQYLDQIEKQVMGVRNHPTRWYALLQELVQTMHSTINEQLIATLNETEAEPASDGAIDTDTLQNARVYSERIQHHLSDMQRDVSTLLPWLGLCQKPPTLLVQTNAQPAVRELWQALQERLPLTAPLAEIATIAAAAAPFVTALESALDVDSSAPEMIREARDWCSHLTSALEGSRAAASTLVERFEELAAAADKFVGAMDFKFLFNKHRQIFHIGYNIDAGELDRNFYDLLASEARVASLIAIAKRDVPQSHWLHLGRPLTQLASGEQVLLSWSGTMFEYLMPPLLLRGYADSLLDQSCRASVRRQIQVGHERKTPWGISESGFYMFDAGMSYQYRAFGAPGLGFKRGLDDDKVVAPYASMLAIAYDPPAVWRNWQEMEKLKLVGRYGLYEAIDFTTGHLTLGKKHEVVRSYMAHHQGMILVALDNYLHKTRMVDRFHAEPSIQSVELLLQEGLPMQAPLQFPHTDEAQQVAVETSLPSVNPWPAPTHSPLPLVHYLSNGEYGLLITNAGAGYSRWQDVQLTRWRADATLDDWGSWIYIQDMESQNARRGAWSAGRQPTAAMPSHEEVIFHAHMAEFRRRDNGIALHMEVTVAAADNVEVRRINLTNDTDQLRRLRLTSYGEVVLGPAASDERHQAFAKLFVESDFVPETNTLLFHRRPRAADEQTHFLAHALLIEPGRELTRAYESDRARFIGRGRSARQPQALDGGDWLSGTVGATLDPIMALGQEIEMAPHSTVRLALLTMTAATRQETLALAQKYQSWGALDRVFQSARATAQAEVHEIGLTDSRLQWAQKLLSLLLYPNDARRAPAETLSSNRKGQPGLWAYGISGDYPVLLVHLREEAEGEVLQDVLRAHRYWRRRGLHIDLVIVNRQRTNYGQTVQNFVDRMISRMESNQWLNQRGGIFVVREDQLSEADRILLQTTARVVLNGAAGPLAEQLANMQGQPLRLPAFEPTLEYAAVDAESHAEMAVARPPNLLFDNGYGGFSADGQEYVIYLRPGATTPAPWINVIANADFGCLVSETGGGYTWSVNSGENRLTTWRNDPVSDQPAEVLYLRDEQTADVWTPTPQPAPANAPYMVRHGAGYSVFEHHSHGLQQFVHIFVAPDAPLKVVHLRLENASDQPRRVTATYYAEWVLGVNRAQSGQYIVSEYAEEVCALLAANTYATDFRGRVAFVAGSKEPHGATTDRAEFLGRLGSLESPAALRRIGLAGNVQTGNDPCAALQLHMDIAPHGVEEIYFLIGQGEDRDEAIRLLKRFQDADVVEEAWRAARAKWDQILGAVTVETPDAAMNLLLNRWLLYQALSCRLWGRSALYQSSGAYGYRDQLQDSMALIHARPDLVRAQLLRAAQHQFEAGDVLHWWHPPGGQGVRTRITDDLLWLPYVTAHYVAATGDKEVLQEKIPYLNGEPLANDEEERYAQYDATEKRATLYAHCLQAIKKGATHGIHGLPRMGAGDWNDGMNRVGIEGRGESVWLGWFIYSVATEFAAICDQVGDGAQAEQLRRLASDYQLALDRHGWDGKWYRRAYYDDGTPLGSAQNRECSIDSIAQSWAVLSGAGDGPRAQVAMQSVLEQLVRWDERLILLFTPPFDKTKKDPGYIKGYLPGIRENGGQYTHAALWAIWAFAELGDGDTAHKLFELINPILRADTKEKADLYKVEPYVISADVYGVEPHVSRGGWTWYTGSSGWMYRLGVEAMLGLQKVAEGLRIAPRIPDHWAGFKATYRVGNATTYEIRVERNSHQGPTPHIAVNEVEVTQGIIPLKDDGRVHQVVVRLGADE
ncbi:MAG: glucoamylase family protein [Caldilineaceae bacterium]